MKDAVSWSWSVVTAPALDFVVLCGDCPPRPTTLEALGEVGVCLLEVRSKLYGSLWHVERCMHQQVWLMMTEFECCCRKSFGNL